MTRDDAIRTFGMAEVLNLESRAARRSIKPSYAAAEFSAMGREVRKVAGDPLAPVKTVTTTEMVKRAPEAVTRTETVRVEHTKWFNADKYEPGQPGVFEVNRVHQFDGEVPGPRRFSYFNGKKFGPISTKPESAFAERFNFSALSSSITQFRGLSEAG